MDTQTQINQCIELIQVKDKPVMFDSPMIVKNSPHSEIFRAYGVVVTNEGELKLMDAAGDWYVLEANQIMSGYVVATLLQRLKIMQPGILIASHDAEVNATIVENAII